jgi:hypothetical protein
VHEQSETVQKGKKWQNVSGHTGIGLKPENPFERELYNTMPEADRAADMRSHAFGRRLQENVKKLKAAPFDKLNDYVDPNQNPRP